MERPFAGLVGIPKLGEAEIRTPELYIHLLHGVSHVPKLGRTRHHQRRHQFFLRDQVVKQSARYSYTSESQVSNAFEA